MDIAYLLWWQGVREATGGALNTVFLWISELGMPTLPMLIVLGLYWSVCKSAGTYLLFTCNVGDFVNGLIKLTACVYRPWIRDGAISPVEGALSGATGYSFPSGHSAKAVALYGGVGYLQRKRRWLAGCMIAVVALVMLSRNYLGVHTPQDVLVGAAIGLLILWLCRRLLQWVDQAGASANRDLWTAAAGTLVCLLSLLYVVLKPYPMDAVNGVLLVDPLAMQADHYTATGAVLGLLWGWLLERRLACFTTDGVRPLYRLLRYLTGVLVALGLLFTLARHGLQGLLGKDMGNLLGTALALFYAAGVHPLLFTKLEARLDGSKAADASRQDSSLQA